MSTKAKRHTHKYHKVEAVGIKIWACALPDCNHHMPPHYKNTLPGKATICWECDEDTVLDTVNMRMDKPKCPNCYGLNDINSFLESKDAITLADKLGK